MYSSYLEPSISQTELLILYALPKTHVSCLVFPVAIDNNCHNSRCKEGKKRREKERIEQRRKGMKRRMVGRKEVKKEESLRIIPNCFFLSLFTPIHQHILLAQTPKSYLKPIISLCILFLLLDQSTNQPKPTSLA